MRHIKFRAWIDGKMVDVKELDFKNGKIGYFPNPQDEYTRVFVSLKDYPIEQFTGLYDRDGKEIWENDLLRVQSQYETDDPIDSMPNKVYFQDGSFRCGFHNMILSENVCTGKVGNWNTKVIGTIHENPELLEGK